MEDNFQRPLYDGEHLKIVNGFLHMSIFPENEDSFFSIILISNFSGDEKIDDCDIELVSITFDALDKIRTGNCTIWQISDITLQIRKGELLMPVILYGVFGRPSEFHAILRKDKEFLLMKLKVDFSTKPTFQHAPIEIISDMVFPPSKMKVKNTKGELIVIDVLYSIMLETAGEGKFGNANKKRQPAALKEQLKETFLKEEYFIQTKKDYYEKGTQKNVVLMASPSLLSTLYYATMSRNEKFHETHVQRTSDFDVQSPFLTLLNHQGPFLNPYADVNYMYCTSVREDAFVYEGVLLTHSEKFAKAREKEINCFLLFSIVDKKAFLDGRIKFGPSNKNQYAFSLEPVSASDFLHNGYENAEFVCMVGPGFIVPLTALDLSLIYMKTNKLKKLIPRAKTHDALQFAFLKDTGRFEQFHLWYNVQSDQTNCSQDLPIYNQKLINVPDEEERIIIDVLSYFANQYVNDPPYISFHVLHSIEYELNCNNENETDKFGKLLIDLSNAIGILMSMKTLEKIHNLFLIKTENANCVDVFCMYYNNSSSFFPLTALALIEKARMVGSLISESSLTVSDNVPMFIRLWVELINLCKKAEIDEAISKHIREYTYLSYFMECIEAITENYPNRDVFIWIYFTLLDILCQDTQVSKGFRQLINVVKKLPQELHFNRIVVGQEQLVGKFSAIAGVIRECSLFHRDATFYNNDDLVRFFCEKVDTAFSRIVFYPLISELLKRMESEEKGLDMDELWDNFCKYTPEEYESIEAYAKSRNTTIAVHTGFDLPLNTQCDRFSTLLYIFSYPSKHVMCSKNCSLCLFPASDHFFVTKILRAIYNAKIGLSRCLMHIDTKDVLTLNEVEKAARKLASQRSDLFGYLVDDLYALNYLYSYLPIDYYLNRMQNIKECEDAKLDNYQPALRMLRKAPCPFPIMSSDVLRTVICVLPLVHLNIKKKYREIFVEYYVKDCLEYLFKCSLEFLEPFNFEFNDFILKQIEFEKSSQINHASSGLFFSCPLCHNKIYVFGNDVAILPCDHCLCSDCFEQHKGENSQCCPSCQNTYKKDDIEVFEKDMKFFYFNSLSTLHTLKSLYVD